MSTLKKSRTCTLCKQIKPLTDYHKDTKGRAGLAARCKHCKNAQKKKVNVPLKKSNHTIRGEHLYIGNDLASMNQIPTTFPIEIRPRLDLAEAIHLLSQKCGKHFSISVDAKKHCRFQTHGDTGRVIKTVTPEELEKQLSLLIEDQSLIVSK